MFLDFVLRKRYLVVFLTLALVALGITCYQELPLEAYPDVANMQVRVITQVPGKAAEEVERLVTVPIEKELNGIPDSKPPRSISIFGLSVITVVFEDNVDPYVARQQVLERIAHVDIPEGIHPELDPNASPVGEIFRYTVEGKHWSTMDRKEIQDWLLNRKFKSVPGIVESTGFGGPTKTYQVEIDPGHLQALGISQAQVAQAIANANGSTGGSYIVRNDQNYMVRGIGLLRSVSDIENVVVSSTKDGIPIRVNDVAQVAIGPAIRKGQVGKNDQDDVVEGILLMRRGENPSRAVANLKSAWNDIASCLPEGMRLEPLYDRTALVRRTINTISHNVAEGIVLVVVLLMLFLFQVRSALICAVVIPLALLTAFVLLTLFKVPANLLSLGAIDFGIIVDGAVVMIENITRHLVHMESTRKHQDEFHVLLAVVSASREVAKPILFSLAIIIMTFLPILSFEHVEGKLFRPLAIMMIFNLLGAVLATMTIIPVLCFFVYKKHLPSTRESPVFVFFERLYKPLLEWSVSHRMTVTSISCGLLLASLSLTPFIGSEFLPELEEGNIWLTVTVLPTSVTLDKAVEIAHEIRHTLKSYSEVTTVITQIGAPDDGTDPNTYSFIEVLVDLRLQDEWRKQFPTKDALVESMNKALTAKLPGLVYNFSQYIKDNMDETISGVRDGEFAIKIFGPDLAILENLGAQIKQIVAKVPGMADVAHDHSLGQPQLVVRIDRERAARYGINANDILDIVETSIGGKNITELIEGDRRFNIVLRYSKAYRDQIEDLGDILVATPSGGRIPLQQLATITEEHGAANIYRDNNERRLAVHANIRGRDLGSAVMESQRLIDRYVKLPNGYHIVFGGQFDRAIEAGKRLSIVVPVTLALVFLLLYSAFGSASIAAVVMGTVPLAALGGIIALFLTGTNFSISSGVGFIALFGVAIQNGVILVSKIRELEGSSMSLRQAVIEGSFIRMKPVLIATMVALVGLVPAALSTGIGSQSQKPFAIVIVGGLLPATILTLLLLPALYLWVGEGVSSRGKRKNQQNQPSPLNQETSQMP